jgi:hypothetical protein
MAYSATNPPKCLIAGVGGGPALWVYTSADARATVEGAGYFANAATIGLKLGDIVIVVYTTGYATTVHAVSAFNAGTGAATLNAAVLA